MRWGGGTVGLSEGANVLIDGQAYIFGNYTGSTAGGNLIMGEPTTLLPYLILMIGCY